jgi:hypothetical protein
MNAVRVCSEVSDGCCIADRMLGIGVTLTGSFFCVEWAGPAENSTLSMLVISSQGVAPPGKRREISCDCTLSLDYSQHL